VPFGGVELPDRTIAWPPDGDWVMSALGLREALASSISVLLPLGQKIDVVSLPMLLVLKALAWADRRTRERGRDAPDLMVILKTYLDAGHAERLYSEAEQLSSAGKFDYESAGAWLAGSDARILLRQFSADPEQIEQTIISVLTPEIEPAPDRWRQSTWKTFLKAHWDVLASVDFTTIEIWTKSGLVTCYLPFVMELATRRVHFAGCTPNPDESWTCQATRNLTDAEDGFLRWKKYLLMDRDTKFSEAFRVTLEQAGVKAVRLPPRSPNLTPHIERFMRSLKDECLHRMIFFGERSLQMAVVGFLAHYHAERNHQGLDNRLIEPGEEVGSTAGEVACRERFGGILRYYYRKAA
jgi:transposase InsO family protein